jgi:restriction endonuclease
MTRDELKIVLAEIDLPFKERQQRRQEREKQAEAEQSGRLPDAEMARWNAHFENRIAEAIASEHEFMIQVVGEALGQVSNQLRDEIDKTIAAGLKQASNQKLADAMQASFNELRQEIKKIRGGLTGEISDLPNPLAVRRLN